MLWAAVDVKDKNCIAEIVEEGAQMRYLSAAVMAKNGMCQSEVSGIIVPKGV